MLVCLDIEKIYSKKPIEKIISFFKRSEVNKTIIKENGVCVLSVDYKQYYGKINFEKIYDLTIGNPKTILCSKDISLKNTPFTRFDNKDYNRKMMENFICNILKNTNTENLSVSFYDPEGDYASLAEMIIDYIPRLRIVSNIPRFYENESDRITEKNGASYIVDNSIQTIAPCDILIAPSSVNIPVPTGSDTLIFTPTRPPVPVRGIVIYDYYPEIPLWCKRIKPDYIEDNYFLSGLYSLCDRYELSHLHPIKCGNDNITLNAENILQYVASRHRTEHIHREAVPV